MFLALRLCFIKINRMEKKHFFEVRVTIDELSGSFIFAKEKQAAFETEKYEKALECYQSQLRVLSELQCTDNPLGTVNVELEEIEHSCAAISSNILQSKRLFCSSKLRLELRQYLDEE